MLSFNLTVYLFRLDGLVWFGTSWLSFLNPDCCCAVAGTSSTQTRGESPPSVAEDEEFFLGTWADLAALP